MSLSDEVYDKVRYGRVSIIVQRGGGAIERTQHVGQLNPGSLGVRYRRCERNREYSHESCCFSPQTWQTMDFHQNVQMSSYSQESEIFTCHPARCLTEPSDFGMS